jgi:hypothetical protein
LRVPWLDQTMLNAVRLAMAVKQMISRLTLGL